jgi:hypothetical protein
MKDAYLRIVSEAGFGEVKIMNEEVFPIDCLANDPTARAIIDQIDVSAEMIADVAGSIVSLKVQGIKPE